MSLVCCGISHRTSTIAERERLQIPRSQIGAATAQFKQLAAADEALILATCHRIEFYCRMREKGDPRAAISRFYRERGLPDVIPDDRRWFIRQESSVARHLFKVAAGLDSPLLGEHQIIGQVKAAYSAACGVGGPGKLLHKLFHFAFKTAKRIRSETDIGAGAQGLAGAVVDLMRSAHRENLSGLKACLVGVNETTAMLLQRLARDRVTVTLLNRTLFKAEKMAHPFNVRAASFGELDAVLNDVDLLVSATAAPDFIVRPVHLATRPKDRPLLIIDLAVPRDVDPAVRDSGAVTLWDLDDIKHRLERSEQARAAELPLALQMVEEGVSEFEQWRISDAAAGNGALRRLVELDRRALLEQFRNDFRAGDLKALDAFSHSLSRQFLRRINNLPPSPEPAQPPSQDN